MIFVYNIQMWRNIVTYKQIINAMLLKEFKSDKVTVQITKQPDRTKSKGFEYYITILKAGIFGGWNIDDSYKQLKPITSEKEATILGQFFFDDNNN